MKLKQFLSILFSCVLISCTDNHESSGKSTAIIVDPDENYIIGKYLKEKLDSSSVYSDSLVAKEISWVKDYLGITDNMILKPIKVDSSSYEILIRPYHFPKWTEPFYLVTNDSIYMLVSAQHFDLTKNNSSSR